MTTIKILTIATPALAVLMHQIEQDFICFTDYDMVDDDIEITICCRKEDSASIERRLHLSF